MAPKQLGEGGERGPAKMDGWRWKSTFISSVSPPPNILLLCCSAFWRHFLPRGPCFWVHKFKKRRFCSRGWANPSDWRQMAMMVLLPLPRRWEAKNCYFVFVILFIVLCSQLLNISPKITLFSSRFAITLIRLIKGLLPDFTTPNPKNSGENSPA